jgi:hypothetical protein
LVVQAGFMDQRPRDLPYPSMMFAAMAIVAPGRGLRRPALARAGARLVGRPVAVAGERVVFDPRVAANLAAGTPWPTGSGPWPTSASAAAACTRHPPNPTTMTPRSTGPAEVAGPARRGHRQRGVVHRVGRRLLLARPTLVDADGQLRHEDAAAVAPGRWSLGLR